MLMRNFPIAAFLKMRNWVRNAQDALPLGLLWFKPYFVVYLDFKIATVLLNSSPKTPSSENDLEY